MNIKYIISWMFTPLFLCFPFLILKGNNFPYLAHFSSPLWMNYAKHIPNNNSFLTWQSEVSLLHGIAHMSLFSSFQHQISKLLFPFCRIFIPLNGRKRNLWILLRWSEKREKSWMCAAFRGWWRWVVDGGGRVAT